MPVPKYTRPEVGPGFGANEGVLPITAERWYKFREFRSNDFRLVYKYTLHYLIFEVCCIKGKEGKKGVREDYKLTFLFQVYNR